MINKSKWSRVLLPVILIVFVSLIGLTGCSYLKTDVENNDDILTEPKDGSLESVKQTDLAYYGEWIINSVQAYGVGTYSGEEAESLLGKSLIFEDDKASCFGDQLSDVGKMTNNPVYTETVIQESDFVVNYSIPLDNLGIESSTVTEVNVSNLSGSICNFFIKDDNTLIIYGGGTYFKLIKKTSE